MSTRGETHIEDKPLETLYLYGKPMTRPGN